MAGSIPALQLEHEDRELRRIALELLLWVAKREAWIAEHEELCVFAKAEIEAKFPEARRAA